MAGLMYETYALQALTAGFQGVQNNLTLLGDILDALNPAELAAAQAYFGNPETKIYIAPGFPMEPSRMPFIGVTVATEDQIANQTPVNFYFGGKNNGSGTWTDYYGARYHGVIKATIYTPNADLLIWLSAVCWWSFMTNVSTFVTTAGMNNVQIGMGDYEPSPVWLPNFVFSRGVWVSGEYSKTISVTSNSMQAGTVTVTAET